MAPSIIPIIKVHIYILRNEILEASRILTGVVSGLGFRFSVGPGINIGFFFPYRDAGH